jgi:hypothetical protein
LGRRRCLRFWRGKWLYEFFASREDFPVHLLKIVRFLIWFGASFSVKWSGEGWSMKKKSNFAWFWFIDFHFTSQKAVSGLGAFKSRVLMYIFDLGRVRMLIKTRLKVKFDRFTIEKMSNFTFNRVLMSIRTRP